jgi:hypothetical protein
MIVNEEGLLKQLPVNVRATTMLYDGNHAARVAPVLVGTCVLLTGRHRLK